MSVCQIDNMNIIAYPRAILRLVIVSVNRDKFRLSKCNVQDPGNNIIWNSLWIFTEQTAFMGAELD